VLCVVGMRLYLLLAYALGGCLVGNDDMIDDSTGEVGAANPGDRLRWTSLSSSCARGSGIVSNGEALSVFFDQGTRWTQCTFSGVLRVPADVRLRGLTQQVRTEGTVAPIRYSARINGTQVTGKTTSSRDVLDAYANLAALGDALCRKSGAGYREIPIAFTATVDGSGVSLDSVDWAFAASNCR
jgi:hypothetical protein